MMRKAAWTIPVILTGVVCGAAAAACGDSKNNKETESTATSVDSVSSLSDSLADSLTANKEVVLSPEDSRREQLHKDSLAAVAADSLTRYSGLSDEDFKYVAEELNVEIAAMKAVVAVEAGSEMKGFWAPGVPVVNFDPAMYKLYGPQAPSRAGNKNAKVPSGLTGYALKEWTQLTNARRVNAQGADMGTFWGMFQIGGFSYKVLGFASINDFVEKMSESDLAQLEIFATFLKNTGMQKYLQAKDWAKFARAYNGPNYAKRGYHTKMAAAYKKFSK